MKYEKRLQTLARRAGLCPIHMARLWCLHCTYVGDWAGTPAQLEELLSLWRRTDPYYDDIRPQGRCPCGGERFCEPCYNAAAARVRVPDDLYTPDERARLHELMGLLCVRDTLGRSPDAL
jgi:hypothetical protein